MKLQDRNDNSDQKNKERTANSTVRQQPGNTQPVSGAGRHTIGGDNGMAQRLLWI